MSHSGPIVSVIIPCYNQGLYLDEAVESILNQTFQQFEIIVINDGSTDEETIRILQNYQRPTVRVIHTENRGLLLPVMRVFSRRVVSTLCPSMRTIAFSPPIWKRLLQF